MPQGAEQFSEQAISDSSKLDEAIGTPLEHPTDGEQGGHDADSHGRPPDKVAPSEPPFPIFTPLAPLSLHPARSVLYPTPKGKQSAFDCGLDLPSYIVPLVVILSGAAALIFVRIAEHGL
jgi:hypothetical protein